MSRAGRVTVIVGAALLGLLVGYFITAALARPARHPVESIVLDPSTSPTALLPPTGPGTVPTTSGADPAEPDIVVPPPTLPPVPAPQAEEDDEDVSDDAEDDEESDGDDDDD